MAKKAKPNNESSDKLPLGVYRHGGPPPHGSKRKNNPPAKLAAEGEVKVLPRTEYAYNPHLPPVLRFDAKGKAGSDAIPSLLAKAGREPLTPDEVKILADALRRHEPWLEWTGKREKPSFAVDPVALHIHERVSTQAILKVAARQDVDKFLFADPEQEYHDAVQFYKHDVDWSNRLILGDSLQVMSSLARREDLAGKVQMIYMDPPYGIKFASNFQPEVGKRDVKDKQEDLTREPEMVRAYRDTWHLGIHSYLSYLRDRLIVARELLADTGSIFVQISDENLHRVRDVMDEVFGATNSCNVIAFHKTMSASGNRLPVVADYLLWYARDATKLKYRPLYLQREGEGWVNYDYLATPAGEFRRMIETEAVDWTSVAPGARVYRRDNLTSQRPAQEGDVKSVDFEGKAYGPSKGTFKTHLAGLLRLRGASRLEAYGSTLSYRRFALDFPCLPLNNAWTDTLTGGFAEARQYVVQTTTKVIARCLLMTTDPGDLVLDPTCGSGTTAYVAEQWGRRWITTDTSRVAIAIARQRLLTGKFDFYKIKDSEPDAVGTVQGKLDGTRSGQRQTVLTAAAVAPEVPKRGFVYKTVPHITLKSIAQNVALDPIFARHEPILASRIKDANEELAPVTAKLREALCAKYAAKAAKDGIGSPTDADARRWFLPGTTRKQIAEALDRAFRKEDKKSPTPKQIDAAFERVPTKARVGASSVPKSGQGWEHWQVPFDTDPEWPKGLRDAVTAYREAWRKKMDEVNACIAASAEQEELVDQPEVVRGVTRVTGPFTVEAVQPPEMSLGDSVSGDFAGEPEQMQTGFDVRIVEPKNDLEVANIGAYLDQMTRFLKADGVRFLNNRQMKWTRFEPLFESGTANPFHAEGRWVSVEDAKGDPKPDDRCNVAVVIGPQYGAVTGAVVVNSVREAHIRGYDHVVIAGFNFDGAAQTAVDKQANLKVKVHLAHIRPDINPGMDGLLKESVTPGGGQLFTVFGLPRIKVAKAKDEDGKTSYTVEMDGVDIYNPVDDSIASASAGKVAAWFLDSDYDGVTFCITQAFFPDKSAWEKLQKALNGKDGPIDSGRFEAFSGTTSLSFPAGKHQCVAVKVIDPRGNEVMAVEKLS
ncbi:MAG: site-specific DNA-methyltransferase [Tepidisphaera sp.]